MRVHASRARALVGGVHAGRSRGSLALSQVLALKVYAHIRSRICDQVELFCESFFKLPLLRRLEDRDFPAAPELMLAGRRPRRSSERDGAGHGAHREGFKEAFRTARSGRGDAPLSCQKSSPRLLSAGRIAGGTYPAGSDAALGSESCYIKILRVLHPGMWRIRNQSLTILLWSGVAIGRRGAGRFARKRPRLDPLGPLKAVELATSWDGGPNARLGGQAVLQTSVAHRVGFVSGSGLAQHCRCVSPATVHP